MNVHPLIFVAFNIFVIIMLILDLKVFHKKAKADDIRSAILWTFFWIGLALVFNAGIWYWMGKTKALEFLTGYLIEKSLSVDNLFVFLVIFSYFGVELRYQHTVLFWGIVGALIMRALFIFMGVALITKFHWVIYIFGAFLVLLAIKMVTQEEKEIKPERNPVLRLVRRFLPVTKTYHDEHFFRRIDHRLHVTPLLIVLVVIETTDIVFAVDSIPAVLAISVDPFIVYTSNIFAILGLRALFFVIAGFMGAFHLLNYGLSLILGFVGIKMLISDFFHIPVSWSLGVVGGVLLVSIVLSLLFPKDPREN